MHSWLKFVFAYKPIGARKVNTEVPAAQQFEKKPFKLQKNVTK